MEFCSKYGYDYGYDGSSSEELDSESEKTSGKKIRKADTNIVSVSFDRLVSTNQMFAGEPIKCTNCEAIMNQISRHHVDSGKKIWNCEFCLEPNPLNILDLNQIPDDTDTNFLIESVPQSNKNSTKKFHENQSFLFYCIDISASMDTEISESCQLSRLDAVKNACIENLTNLKSTQASKPIGLVTFSSRVRFIGDNLNSQKHLTLENTMPKASRSSSLLSRIKSVLSSNGTETANILDDREKLIELGRRQDKNLRPILESHRFLTAKIESLETEGATALGPALTFLIGFLDNSPGSQIILCTDGAANVGVGSIKRNERAEAFYEQIADYAKSRGIVVNVITMKGTDCKLGLLGKVADRTNGSVNIVKPSELSQELHTILQNRLIATHASAKLIVSKYLYIRDDILEETEMEAYEKNDCETLKNLEKNRKSFLVKDIGNVNVETEINFEYGIKTLDEKERKSAKELEKLPFQVQISYTLPNGARALRVLTKCQEFTSDRHKAENQLNSKEILWSSFSQKMSTYVARSSLNSAKRSMKQLRAYEKRNQVRIPKSLDSHIKLFSGLSSSTRAEQLSDEQIKNVLKAKRSNRASYL
ncbi:circularly permutated Ras 1-like [Brachionus plicatilis]|uniref:Circularly permutated Ras 1-like n=1 Tax=Brachionus plicatilis TaxID=10195 RepID=A0A3M7QB54_BRAPC|nr:circularly permutated Ras 1-like [Brachionus plicatilis]